MGAWLPLSTALCWILWLTCTCWAQFVKRHRILETISKIGLFLSFYGVSLLWQSGSPEMRPTPTTEFKHWGPITLHKLSLNSSRGVKTDLSKGFAQLHPTGDKIFFRGKFSPELLQNAQRIEAIAPSLRPRQSRRGPFANTSKHTKWFIMPIYSQSKVLTQLHPPYQPTPNSNAQLIRTSHDASLFT